MPVLSSQEERLLRRLVDFAGSPETLEEALVALRSETSSPPTLEELLQRILEIREGKAVKPELVATSR